MGGALHTAPTEPCGPGSPALDLSPALENLFYLYIALAVYVTLENALLSLALMYRIMSNDMITWVPSSSRIPNETSRGKSTEGSF